MKQVVHIVGRFPPPTDGQTMATQRLAELLAPSFDVRRFDVSFQELMVQAAVRLRPDKVRHYLGLRRRLREALSVAPGAPVLWASISPMPFGHARDLATVAPAFRSGQSVFGVVHWGNFDRVFRSSLTTVTARRLVERLRGIVFLNEGLAERCAAWVPAAKRFVIPNTIDAGALCSDAEVAAKQAGAPQMPLRLLFLSNMIREKGYLDVLEAVRRLHAQGVPVHADFAGGWTAEADRHAFEAKVARYDLSAVVTHHGSVRDRVQVKALYLAADLFLLPTYYPTEAQPLSILEALNAGTPVIATRHAGIPDMVRDGEEAVFVPPHEPTAIAEAVTRLADPDRWRDASERARRRFLARFSPDAVRRQWTGLLETAREP